MSNTPRTDAIAHRGYHMDALAARSIDLCRELERENAALKQRIFDDNKAYGCELRDPSGTIWDHAKELEIENANLREDKERLDWLARNRSVSTIERPLFVTPESLRAAIDAARKEAQP